MTETNMMTDPKVQAILLGIKDNLEKMCSGYLYDMAQPETPEAWNETGEPNEWARQLLAWKGLDPEHVKTFSKDTDGQYWVTLKQPVERIHLEITLPRPSKILEQLEQQVFDATGVPTDVLKGGDQG